MYPHLSDAVESILSQTYNDAEIIIVVDGNNELFGRIQEDYAYLDSTTCLSNDENIGLLRSRNRGARDAKGDIIAFIDDDAVADTDWLQEIVATYRNSDAISVGGRMEPIWLDGKPEFLPEEYYWLIGVTHRGFATGAGEVRNTFGSNISFERKKFLDVNGFDTEIGGRKGDQNLQGGETELCARLRRKFGKGVMYNPDAIVRHKIFKNRTKFVWLVDRAFWQGYSKRVMQTMTKDATDEESRFLKLLMLRYFPTRCMGLLKAPTIKKLTQLVTLIILTASVGAGYAYAIFLKR